MTHLDVRKLVFDGRGAVRSLTGLVAPAIVGIGKDGDDTVVNIIDAPDGISDSVTVLLENYVPGLDTTIALGDTGAALAIVDNVLDHNNASALIANTIDGLYAGGLVRSSETAVMRTPTPHSVNHKLVLINNDGSAIEISGHFKLCGPDETPKRLLLSLASGDTVVMANEGDNKLLTVLADKLATAPNTAEMPQLNTKRIPDGGKIKGIGKPEANGVIPVYLEDGSTLYFEGDGKGMLLDTDGPTITDDIALLPNWTVGGTAQIGPNIDKLTPVDWGFNPNVEDDATGNTVQFAFVPRDMPTRQQIEVDPARAM